MAKNREGKGGGIRVGCGTLPHEEIVVYPPVGQVVRLKSDVQSAVPGSGHKKVEVVRRQEGRGRKD